ncbi:transcriptional Coactivator p15-domain-containing protein [Geopyxis carbonaria]|nr:transcriptional Coactivator p15-domain-containing protein [Geopyxis carbonaria]
MPPKKNLTSKRKAAPAAEQSKKKNKRTASEDSDKHGASPPADLGKELKDDEGNSYWEIGGRLRRITLSQFKGNNLVSIREYYEKDGKTLPGKKGISLSIEQLDMFLSILPQLESKLRDKDIILSRPNYGVSPSHQEDAEKEIEERNEEVEKQSEEDDC